MRIYVYVDGFNLYYGCLKGSPYKWLNLQKLSELLFQNHTITKIKYSVERTVLATHVEIKPISTKPSQKDLWRRFLDKVQIGKRKKLEKIMIMFLKKSKITNDEVEKFLHVSDATATRYLSILEKESVARTVLATL